MDAAALNTVDLETLRTWRSEAIAARHQLTLGKSHLLPQRLQPLLIALQPPAPAIS